MNEPHDERETLATDGLRHSHSQYTDRGLSTRKDWEEIQELANPEEAAPKAVAVPDAGGITPSPTAADEPEAPFPPQRGGLRDRLERGEVRDAIARNQKADPDQGLKPLVAEDPKGAKPVVHTNPQAPLGRGDTVEATVDPGARPVRPNVGGVPLPIPQVTSSKAMDAHKTERKAMRSDSKPVVKTVKPKG